jgi:hypothetical protein
MGTLTILNQPVLISGSIVVSTSRERVLDSALIVNEPTRSTQTINQGYSVRFCCLRWYHPIFLPALSFFVISHNFNYQLVHKKFMVVILCKTRPCFGIPDSLLQGLQCPPILQFPCAIVAIVVSLI